MAFPDDIYHLDSPAGAIMRLEDWQRHTKRFGGFCVSLLLLCVVLASGLTYPASAQQEEQPPSVTFLRRLSDFPHRGQMTYVYSLSYDEDYPLAFVEFPMYCEIAEAGYWSGTAGQPELLDAKVRTWRRWGRLEWTKRVDFDGIYLTTNGLREEHVAPVWFTTMAGRRWSGAAFMPNCYVDISQLFFPAVYRDSAGTVYGAGDYSGE